jgi:hypothetical protein
VPPSVVAHEGNCTVIFPLVAEKVPFHCWLTVVPDGSVKLTERPASEPAGPEIEIAAQ